jgi:hypothetical protein
MTGDVLATDFNKLTITDKIIGTHFAASVF